MKSQLFMRLPFLGGGQAPRELPEGYSLQVAGPPEHPGIGEVLTEAFEEPWDAERVAKVLSPEEGVDAIYIVRGPAGPAAVASSRFLPEHYPGAGYLHYVGVRSSERGKGLGEAVVAGVLAHFAGAGVDQAVLETDDFRIPAIRVYLHLGFVPEYRQPSDQLRWSNLLPSLLQRRPTGPEAAATGTDRDGR